MRCLVVRGGASLWKVLVATIMIIVGKSGLEKLVDGDSLVLVFSVLKC